MIIVKEVGFNKEITDRFCPSQSSAQAVQIREWGVEQVLGAWLWRG